MSKGGGGGQQFYGLPTFHGGNSNTSTTIPDWLTDASRYGINYARDMLNRGATPYTGQIVPGLTADQIAAGNMFRNNIGAFQDWFNQGRDMTAAGTRAAPNVRAQTYKDSLAGINDYMNPYIKNVVNSVQDIGKQNLDQALTQTADKAASAGAFGGSRHGVQEGVATAQNNLNTNNLVSNLLSQGYDKATGLMGQDISNNLQAQSLNQRAFQDQMARLLQAGGQTANIGNMARQAQVGDINNLLQYGTLDQQNRKDQNQAQYNEWLRQQNYPLQLMQLYNQTVQGAPHNTNSNTSTFGWSTSPQQRQSSNPLGGALGLGMAGLSMLPGGTIPGLLGAGFGALSGWSPFPHGDYFKGA